MTDELRRSIDEGASPRTRLPGSGVALCCPQCVDSVDRQDLKIQLRDGSADRLYISQRCLRGRLSASLVIVSGAQGSLWPERTAGNTRHGFFGGTCKGRLLFGVIGQYAGRTLARFAPRRCRAARQGSLNRVRLFSSR